MRCFCPFDLEMRFRPQPVTAVLTQMTSKLSSCNRAHRWDFIHGFVLVCLAVSSFVCYSGNRFCPVSLVYPSCLGCHPCSAGPTPFLFVLFCKCGWSWRGVTWVGFACLWQLKICSRRRKPVRVGRTNVWCEFLVAQRRLSHEMRA